MNAACRLKLHLVNDLRNWLMPWLHKQFEYKYIRKNFILTFASLKVDVVSQDHQLAKFE